MELTMGLTYGSVCSGVEAASLAWEWLGWKPLWFSEIEPFPAAVLACRWPAVPNLGDMTCIALTEKGEVTNGDVVVPGRLPDVLVGGTPCQGFSVAGRQEGLRDPRSALALCFVRLVGLLKPAWVCWENVPGVLGCGDDFRCFAGAIADLGYGLAWRVLDAQYVRVDGFPHAVPQRRRRLFLVGRLGGWEPAAKVLFEPEGVSRNPPPRIQARQANRPGPAAGVGGGGESVKCYEANRLIETPASRNIVGDHDCRVTDMPTLVAHCAPVAGTITARETAGGVGTSNQELFAQKGAGLICMASGQHNAPVAVDHAPTLTALHEQPIVCQGADIRHGELSGDVAVTITTETGDHVTNGPSVIQGCDVYNGQVTGDCAATMTSANGIANASEPKLLARSMVRRLTPVECERLMGFPDNHTRIPWRGKPAEECPDGPRYKCCGNSMCVNVMRWIGQRIQMAEEGKL